MRRARSGLARTALAVAAVGLAYGVALPSWAQEHDRGPEHREMGGHERERHEHRRPVRHEYVRMSITRRRQPSMRRPP